MAAVLPASIAAALAAGAKPRMPLSRALRTLASATPSDVAARNTPMADMVELAQSVMRRKNIPSFEIVFSAGKSAGRSFKALAVLDAPPSLKPLPFAWPSETPACCLHCGERIKGRPFFAILQRLRTGKLEAAHALFCNQGPAYCNLAWLEDDYRGTDRSNAAALTRDAMALYLGVTGPMYRAPPRVALAKYSHTGRGMTLPAFHAQGHSGDGTVLLAAALVPPPLITYAAVLECRTEVAASTAAGEATGAGHDVDGNVVAFANSMGCVRGLTRPTRRDAALAEVMSTGKPPLILSYIAAKLRERQAAPDAAQTQTQPQLKPTDAAQHKKDKKPEPKLELELELELKPKPKPKPEPELELEPGLDEEAPKPTAKPAPKPGLKPAPRVAAGTELEPEPERRGIEGVDHVRDRDKKDKNPEDKAGKKRKRDEPDALADKKDKDKNPSKVVIGALAKFMR